jgi:hypothetical protein
MRLADLLRETLTGECTDVWENERTPETRPAVADCCQQFRRYNNRQRPNQTLEGKTPAEVLN